MKRLVLFSDGTGNSSAKAQKTNVWRMFQALDQTLPDQLAKYDDGVGTSANKYLAALGGAFGFGLKRNVIDLYKFVCRKYKAGDEIFGFGFSRGAFTIRVVVALIETEGLVAARSESELHTNSLSAYRRYRVKRFKSKSPFVWVARQLRDLLLWPSTRAASKRPPGPYQRANLVPIKFLGLWDTVGAYGMPIDELKWGFNLLVWPMVAVDHYLFERVGRACHALALDEQRETFSPILFDEAEEARRVEAGSVPAGRLTQVWFAGVHSNIGGGYPEDRASLVSLDWMMSQACHEGLRLKTGAVGEIADERSAFARLYDSRAGVMAYYRYSSRNVSRLVDPERKGIRPIVHGSAVMRMALGSDAYAPISLPEVFNVMAPDGTLLQMRGFPADSAAFVNRPKATTLAPPLAADRTEALKAAIADMGEPDGEMVRQVQDSVWWRRVTYFTCLFFTLCLVAFPFAAGVYGQVAHFLARHIPWIGPDLDWEATTQLSFWDRFGQGGVKTVVETVAPLFPSYLGKWLTSFEQQPFEMLVAVLLVAIPFSLGTLLASRVHDRAWFAWRPARLMDYLDWVVESAQSARVRAAVIAGVLIGLCVASTRLSWEPRTTGLLEVALAASLLVLGWRMAISRRLRRLSKSIVATGKITLPSTRR